MINKLIFGRKYVLTPLLRKLQKEGRNKRLKEYDDLISQNIESQQILLKLLASGMFDGDIYTQESTRLKNEFDRLQKEKSLISAENREENNLKNNNCNPTGFRRWVKVDKTKVLF